MADHGLTLYNNAGIDQLVQEMNNYYDLFTSHEHTATSTDKALMAAWGGQGHGAYQHAFKNMMDALQDIQNVMAQGTSGVINAALNMNTTDKEVAARFEGL
ncbi:WXG100 family type VII secretion target [Nocardia sp. NPDC052566]|uniref:WXG100 family type VII secretion target n=1 Tax=Nocardia sp. NPDC052566 TaxID=3364330 RepID=UPI0037CB06A8